MLRALKFIAGLFYIAALQPLLPSYTGSKHNLYLVVGVDGMFLYFRLKNNIGLL